MNRIHEAAKLSCKSICVILLVIFSINSSAESEKPRKNSKFDAIAGTVLQLAAMNYTGPHQQLAHSLVTLFNGGELSDQQAYYNPDDPYGVYAGSEYTQEEYGYEDNHNSYDPAAAPAYGDDPYQTAGYYPEGTPSIDAALIGRSYDGTLQVMDSGVTLRGPGNGYPGDRVGVAFAPASDVYVYVVAFDSTGWIQALYPDPALGHRNPVPTGQEILLPGESLFGLDNVTGVETIYILASNSPRHDVESQLAPFFGKERPPGAQPVYRSVERPIIISRGLTGLRPASVNQVSTSTSLPGDDHELVMNSFLAGDGADELVITLWFNHE